MSLSWEALALSSPANYRTEKIFFLGSVHLKQMSPLGAKKNKIAAHNIFSSFVLRQIPDSTLCGRRRKNIDIFSLAAEAQKKKIIMLLPKILSHTPESLCLPEHATAAAAPGIKPAAPPTN